MPPSLHTKHYLLPLGYWREIFCPLSLTDALQPLVTWRNAVWQLFFADVIGTVSIVWNQKSPVSRGRISSLSNVSCSLRSWPCLMFLRVKGHILICVDTDFALNFKCGERWGSTNWWDASVLYQTSHFDQLWHSGYSYRLTARRSRVQ